MATITASLWKSVMHISDISDTDAEYIIDLAIDRLNLEGNLDLPNMGGTAGSKTVSLESREKAAVFEMARIIYNTYYKEPRTVAVNGVNVGITDLLANPTINAAIERMARKLSEFDVGYS